MSASFGGSGESSQDFELNIASIIDCFTVLITFLLASASFLSIGIFDAGLSGVGQAPTGEAPDVDITVRLKRDQSVEFEMTGKSGAKGKYATSAELGKKLGEIKAKYPSLQFLTLIPEDAVEYEMVIQTMADLRKEIPSVLLGAD